MTGKRDDYPEGAPVDREITGGGTFASGTGPVNYGTTPITLQPGEDLRIDQTNTTTIHTFTVKPRGGPSYSYVLARNASKVFPGRGIQSIAADAADAGAQWERKPAGGFAQDPSGPGTVYAQFFTPQGVLIADAAGSARTSFASGSSAPADGIAFIRASVSDANGVTVSDGTNSQVLSPGGTIAGTGTASIWERYDFPVVKGLTYTLSGTTLKVLGSKMVYIT